MNSMKILQQAVEMIRDKKHNKAVELVREHFEGNKLEAGFNKNVAKKRLKEVIALGTGKKELEIEPIDLVYMGMGEKRKVKPFGDAMVKALKSIMKIVDGAEQSECDHGNAKIIPLLYGGGFTPMMSRPELVCPDCGLNVTLDKKAVMDAGVPKEYLKHLHGWSIKQGNVLSSSKVVTNPRETLEESTHYDGDVEPIFKVIKKLESLSGQ